MHTKEIIIKGVKARILKNKIQASVKSAIKQSKAVKGRGIEVLQNLGTELKQSSNPYKDCKKPADAAAVLLDQLRLILTPAIKNGDHSFTYKSDDLLLISIDGVLYEITGSDLKSSILKMAKNAGIPAMFSGVNLAKLLIDGLIAFWKKSDPSYNDKASRLLE